MSIRIVNDEMSTLPDSGLLDNLRQLIISARQKVLRAVDVITGADLLGDGTAYRRI